LTPLQLLALIVVFLITSIISVVTGSTSLITVPALFTFGVDPRVAVATNMFALTLMSVGGALPFLGNNMIDRRRLPLLVGLTLAGSIIGALLVLVVPSQAMPPIISIFMLAVALFTLTKQDAGLTQGRAAAPTMEVAGYGVTFAMGIYGGFFSGGYVTILTVAYITLFSMTFVEAVALTKVINVVSSLMATFIFMGYGLIDYPLGLILGAAMFMGAVVGARAALRLNNIWLRRIFVTTVIGLALKTLLYDFAWKLLN
jgi:uncharacterized membrane protein YfcA